MGERKLLSAEYAFDIFRRFSAKGEDSPRWTDRWLMAARQEGCVRRRRRPGEGGRLRSHVPDHRATRGAPGRRVGALSRPGRWQVSWGLRARRCAFLPNTPGKLRPALRQAVPVVGWLWLAFRFSSSGLAKRYPRAGSVCSVGGRGEAPFGRACRRESFGSGPHATQKGGRILFPSEQGSDATATLQQCPCCGYFVFFPGSASKTSFLLTAASHHPLDSSSWSNTKHSENS